MNKTNLKNKAKELLLCDDNTIEEHEIEDMKAMYYRNTVRGGGAIIISESGEMLFVNPFFVDYKEHITRFKNKERSIFLNNCFLN